MLKFMQETLSVWELLQHTKKPIVLYGMGNGADKNYRLVRSKRSAGAGCICQ